MKSSSLMTVLAFVVGCGGPDRPPDVDPDAPPLDKALAAVGGRDALVALSSFRITAGGERRMTLEGYVPEDESHPVSTFESEVTADVSGDRLRIAYRRMNLFFGAAPTYDIIIDGDVGVLAGVESVFGFPGGDLPSDRVASTLRQHRLLNPQLLLRAVALGELTARDAGLAVRDGELRHRIEIGDDVHPLSLFIDRETGEITELATLENDYVSGDTALDVYYEGWRAWDGDVQFPSEVVIALAGQELHAEHRTAVATNTALDDGSFAFPPTAAPTYVAEDAARGARTSQFHESFAALGVPLDGLQTYIEAQQLATGVWHLRGGSHHSLVIEQAAGVVVVEAPLYEARAQAVLAWIAANIPNKPVTHVIATHHHRDHAGALRTFVARGARVIVGAAARPFLGEAFRAARTIEPDELAAAPRAAAFDTVARGGELVLADSTRPVQVFAIESTHAADMLIAYVPGAQVVFVSDIYSPGFPPNPFGARELRNAVVARGLSVTTIAGGHGGVGPRADLDAAAGL